MPKSGPDGGMDLLAQAIRKVYTETFGDAAESASDDAKPTEDETDSAAYWRPLIDEYASLWLDPDGVGFEPTSPRQRTAGF